MSKLQEERVLKYMDETGDITRLDAMLDLGIANLPAVINRLRKDGYNIKTEKVKSKNRYGEPITYAKYSRDGEPPVNPV